MRNAMTPAYRYLAAAALVLGVGVVVPACAAERYPYRYGSYDDSDYNDRQNIERLAFQNGYDEGLEHGRRDLREGRQYSIARHDEFRDGDEGYRRSYGDRELYRRLFRQGFERGYADAYRRGPDRYRGW
jgi:hypothetical protein